MNSFLQREVFSQFIERRVDSISLSEEDESQILSSIVIVNYKDNKYSFYGNKDSYIEELKKDVVKKILDHVPSELEFNCFSLSYNGLTLEESKTIEECKVIGKEIDCNEEDDSHICVYDILDDFQKDIHFNTSISIAKVLQCVVGKCADEYFLTEKGSSIVLRNALSSSTDVTRIILFCA